MTTLDAVAAYLPDLRVPVDDLAGEVGATPTQLRVLKRFNGFAEVRRQRPGETLGDLLYGAAAALDALRGREHRVRYVLHARGVPVVTPYPGSPVHELADRLGLPGAVCLAVTHHACASGLLAIDLAGRLLAADGEPGALALVVAGEQIFTQDSRLAPDQRVFGEAAGACLVSADGPRDRLLSYVVSQRGDLDHWADDGAAAMARFARDYTELLGEVVLAAVKEAGLVLDEVALVLPHNVNTVSWRRVARSIGIPLEKVLLDNVALVGHTPTADAFVNYATAVAQGRLREGDRYVVAAAGLGSIFSAMAFEH
jgi:3-oxoacyl-[acyl-carrier-protein] synthase-3